MEKKEAQQLLSQKVSTELQVVKTANRRSPVKKKVTMEKISIDKIDEKVKIISLGGLGEIGKNLTVFETSKDIIIVDCGLSFPDSEMLGVDIVVPDMSYLEFHKDKIRGLIITHAHEDHIGGIPYLLDKINIPIYGTRLTLGVLEHKLVENDLLRTTETHVVKSGQMITLGNDFAVEFIKVNHSIPGAVAVAITTPVGIIMHTGDFKIDTTPVNSSVIDLTRFGEYGKQGVKLLLMDSTNAEKQGWTFSEKKVESEMMELFTKYSTNRITVATFSSNIYRLQSVIKAAIAHKRKIAITGRSIMNITEVAIKLGYLKIPKNMQIDIEEVNNYPDNKVAIITTGSQGEPMSVLNRIACGEHKVLTFDENDVVILSSHAIPGNEKLVNTVVNKLADRGVRVVGDNTANVHVSGHACVEELKLMHSLIKPEYFMPVHGERKHLLAHKQIAMEMGMDEKHIIISDIGNIVELTENSCRTNGIVDSGIVMIDNNNNDNTSLSSLILKDRKVLSKDGIVIITCTVDFKKKLILAKCEVATRGFLDTKENGYLFKKLRLTLDQELKKAMELEVVDWAYVRGSLRDAASKFIYNETRRNPMILPIIMNI